MHLLQAQAGALSDAVEPIDPDQSPADIVVASAADTELAALSEARTALGADAPSLRLAQLGWLAHPYAVDLYLEKTALRSKLVIARILGGEAYWSYGLEQFSARLGAAGVAFAALPGDDKPDEALFRASSVARAEWERLWGYLLEGGPENAANLLRMGAHLLGRGEAPPAPRPLVKAGLYWPARSAPDLAALEEAWAAAGVRDGPVVALTFYRALLQGAGLNPIHQLIQALLGQGLRPLPVFVASLKDPVSAAVLARTFEAAPPDLTLNATGFAVASPAPEDWRAPRGTTPLDAPGAPVLQIVLSGGTETAWAEGDRGLTARDIAMNVALPEVDGRVLARAVSFKDKAFFDAACQAPITAYRAQGDRIAFTAALAAAWTRLARTPVAARRVALVLANYPNKDGRLANGVGLDTPASAVGALQALAAAGYEVADPPVDSAGLMAQILAGPTNWRPDRAERTGGARLALSEYRAAYDALPLAARTALEARWGAPEADPYLDGDAFALSILAFGNVVVGVQPARGYDIDPTETYHSPDLPPPHHYLAFYFWLRRSFGAQAIAHLGKHGNLEWLPGKALALSETCWPEIALGPTPHLYPFIVNDPGEGTQAKRRAQAVILDHLTPPMTRAETYGPLKELEALVDEYYEAAGVDARRVTHLRDEILSLTETAGLDVDAGLGAEDDADSRLRKLDAYLCELKESQIRNGLHVFGASPADGSEGPLETDLIAALARAPRGRGAGGDASLIRALAADLLGVGGGLAPPSPALPHEGGEGARPGGDARSAPGAAADAGARAEAGAFDPLDADLGAAWTGARPTLLAALSTDPWRTVGDTVERLELLAARLISGTASADPGWAATAPVLREIEERVRPMLRACGERETAALLAGLDGRFVAPGPSGAPTRGRLDALPTGRNFFSVDSRAVPTPAAWALGWRSAALLIERHLQDQGDWPRALLLTAWGTANMRTGGDDIAQALALMGARPTWDAASRRVTGFEILPLSVLGRPRVDVTLRVSGFFRDAFPTQIELVDQAARAIMALDEPAAENPAAAAFRAAGGDRSAGFRVFGSKPGAYGAGLQALIDERIWRTRADLADAYLEWGGYAYGAGATGGWGERARGALETRLGAVDAVVQNQDNREHDLLDSDDYYQFEGGATAAAAHLSGAEPVVYHNDHSRPERPVIRTLSEEIGRVMRSRVVNPKWLAGVRRHGYKGAFEIAATVDYLFAFAASTRAVPPHHFDLAAAAYLEDETVREFLAEANPAALREIADRFQEAMDRGLWSPRSNRLPELLSELRGAAEEQASEPGAR